MTSASIPLAVFVLLFALPFGLATGAFVNEVVEGARVKKMPARLRSRCKSCGAPAPLWQSAFPIVAAFVVRGGRRCCGERIAWRLAVIQAFCTVLSVICSVLVKSALPPTAGMFALHGAHVAACYALFSAFSAAIILIDREEASRIDALRHALAAGPASVSLVADHRPVASS